jgi:transcriptional regulator of nitric oxide reductase/ferredoxin
MKKSALRMTLIFGGRQPGARRYMTLGRLTAFVLLLAVLTPLAAQAQRQRNTFTPSVKSLLPIVMPAATRFTESEGQPPVIRGYGPDPITGKETLLGYAFLTSDLPPEEIGYSGPIQVLVGMDVTGKLTGIQVIDYRESLRSSRGDFLGSQTFQDQYAGKVLADPFRPRMDIQGISGATITVTAMSRGIRNAARRVASAYLTKLTVPEPLHPGTATSERLLPLSWPDIVDGGLVQTIMLLENDHAAIDLYLVLMRNEGIGSSLIGSEAYQSVLQKGGERTARDHLVLVGVDGPLAPLFRASAMYMVQDGDTLKLRGADYVSLGAHRAGKIGGQVQSAGVLMLDSAAIDAQRPFTMVLDLRPGLSFASTEFPGLTPPPPPKVMTAAAPPAPAAPVPTAATTDAPASAPVDAEPAPAPAPTNAPAAANTATEPTLVASADPSQILEFEFEEEEESLLERTLANTSWPRVAGMILVLALASVAFALKKVPLRWVSLGVTMTYLGFLTGGFLSVSHITSAIKVGPSVFLSDIPLLLFAVFTAITTLLWGRVFCGFLCPFGALQDFMEKVVPERFRRELPDWIHDRALWIKYFVLAGLILPVLAGVETSLFQYAEPFGTVFFFSASVVLWVIAGGILLGAAIVPRFYCRYLCPLGASLAVVSVISPFRIKRVEQCSHCKVCEQRCPTGAIRQEVIDFKECVRCNVCEVALIEKAGVCKHDMEEIRPRLVQLKVASGRS